MSVLPKINMRRTLLIARRDYFGYIKTWGFWISFFLPFVFGIIGFFAASMDFDFSPPKYETILDQTGQHEAGIKAKLDADNQKVMRTAIEGMTKTPLFSDQQGEALLKAFDDGGTEAAKAYIRATIPTAAGQLDNALDNLDFNVIFVEPPARSLDGLMPYLLGDSKIMVDGEPQKLNGALLLTPNGSETKIEYWSTQINSPKVQSLTERYFRDRAEDAYLSSKGLSKEGLKAARSGSSEVVIYNPEKAADETGGGQAVTKEDRIPYAVAMGLSIVLWFTVFSGAYMLLTSMLEEKLNKLLEMMLASTRFSEIILGKLLGVAALTITALAPYIIIGIVGIIGVIAVGPPEISAALQQSFTPQILLFFALFLVLGYIFYGACFIALGSLSQSMQDAQTLTTPIVLILTLCMLVVPIGLENPDSPIIYAASFFPLSSPFAMLIRLPSNPQLWEVLLSVGILLLSCIAVIMLAGRIFRFGVLSGAGVGAVSAWFKRTVLRRSAG